MAIKIHDLRGLKRDLLVKIHFLRADDVQLGDLVLDDLLPVVVGLDDLVDLNLDLCDLFLGVFDHLVAVLNLGLEMSCKLRLLSGLEVVLEQLLTVLE